MAKLTNSYLSALCLEMSMVLNAGMTVSEGMEMCLADETRADSKKVLARVLDNLHGGVSLSAAMNKAGYFPPHMVHMMEIGEKTGRSAEALKALSEHYDRRARLRAAIKNATLYPTVLLVMMLAVVLVLVVRVVPIFNDVFARMGRQMSPFALRVMDVGVWLRNAANGMAAVFLVILATVFIIWAVGPLRRGALAGLRGAFGGVGIFGQVASLRFVSGMALGVASGLSVEDAVGLAASLNADTKALSQKYEKCVRLLREGNPPAESLRAAGIVSPRDGRLLSLGEKSGMSEFAMAEIARRGDRAVQDEIDRAVGCIEPALVIITSVIVGIILLSVMMPLVGIMTAIG